MRSSVRCWLLGIALTAGCVRAVPPVGLVPVPSGTSVRMADVDVRGLIVALLASVEPDTKIIVAGRNLDSAARVALRSLRAPVLEQSDDPGSSSVPPNAMVIDQVEVFGDKAAVRLTVGPVPSEIAWVCGRAMTVPLQRKIVWQVLDEWFPVRCAQRGPAGLPPERARFLEAARLAFSQIRLDPAVRVVSGPQLSTDALAVLSLVRDVPEGQQFESPAMVVPGDVFVVRKLEHRGDVVELAGTLGPVARHATLACGTSWSVTLRQQSDAWVFQNVAFTVC